MTITFQALLPDGAFFRVVSEESVPKVVQAISVLYWEFHGFDGNTGKPIWAIEHPRSIKSHPWGASTVNISAVGCTAMILGDVCCPTCEGPLLIKTRTDLMKYLEGERVICRNCDAKFMEKLPETRAKINQQTHKLTEYYSTIEVAHNKISAAPEAKMREGGDEAKKILLEWDVLQTFSDVGDQIVARLRPAERAKALDILSTPELVVDPSPLCQSLLEPVANPDQDIAIKEATFIAQQGLLIRQPSTDPAEYFWDEDMPGKATFMHPAVKRFKLRGPCKENQLNAFLLRRQLVKIFDPFGPERLDADAYQEVVAEVFLRETQVLAETAMMTLGLPPMTRAQEDRLFQVLHPVVDTLSIKSVAGVIFALAHGRPEAEDIVSDRQPQMIGTLFDSTIVAPFSVDEFIDHLAALAEDIPLFANDGVPVNLNFYPTTCLLFWDMLGMQPHDTLIGDVAQRLSSIDKLLVDPDEQSRAKLAAFFYGSSAATVEEFFNQQLMMGLVTQELAGLVQQRMDQGVGLDDIDLDELMGEVTNRHLDDPLSLDQAKEMLNDDNSLFGGSFSEEFAEEIERLLNDDEDPDASDGGFL
ncbi:hypothetical protein [Corynebacterium aquilae]|uniref:Uncharacterized protein n=1 Tax=Corynebacterium aquilae DSM 44791 TaxID=1431546 RepID=A0A1L7CEZ2_9CORY|nr:hypothetical protein [Corynebacterium aquilae]APT84398.1 hypothetical protein CAQU_04165 [Corynebacterium aquilae DSM 44791]